MGGSNLGVRPPAALPERSVLQSAKHLPSCRASHDPAEVDTTKLPVSLISTNIVPSSSQWQTSKAVHTPSGAVAEPQPGGACVCTGADRVHDRDRDSPRYKGTCAVGKRPKQMPMSRRRLLKSSR